MDSIELLEQAEDGIADSVAGEAEEAESYKTTTSTKDKSFTNKQVAMTVVIVIAVVAIVVGIAVGWALHARKAKQAAPRVGAC